jgi:hypothetical protein
VRVFAPNHPGMSLSVEEAKEIMRRLGPAELQFVISISAPLYWEDHRRPDGRRATRNGTAFFLRTHEAMFGVTAAHVIEGQNSWRAYCHEHGPTPLRLAGRKGNSIELPWDARCVDINLEIDIATFMIADREIASIDRTIYSGYQASWPPPPPAKNKGIFYCGFPTVGTHVPSRNEVVFGAFAGSGVASAVNDRDVLTQVEREYLEPALGEGIPPENYNFGGISGGPMLHVVETKSGLRLNALAGVIYAGPNTSDDPNKAIPGFELFYARRPHFIRADGFLEHELWSSVCG